MNGRLIDYPPFDLNRSVLGTGNRGVERSDSRLTYVAPRLVELTRSSAIAICGEAGCPESPRPAGGAS